MTIVAVAGIAGLALLRWPSTSTSPSERLAASVVLVLIAGAIAAALAS